MFGSLFDFAVLCVHFSLNHLAEEERARFFTVIVFLLSCSYNCYISLPHGAMGWSVVCDCGISWSYLLLPFC